MIENNEITEKTGRTWEMLTFSYGSDHIILVVKAKTTKYKLLIIFICLDKLLFITD